MSEAAQTKVRQIIDNNAVVVFSKSYCPHCTATKKPLEDLGAKFFLMELDQEPDGADIQDALEKITHQRTVPNIFIEKKHIGGNTDFQKLVDKLPSILKAANAL